MLITGCEEWLLRCRSSFCWHKKPSRFELSKNDYYYAKTVVEGYEYSGKVVVTTSELDKAAPIWLALSDCGSAVTFDMDFGIADETPARNSLLEYAVQEARKNAEILARRPMPNSALSHPSSMTSAEADYGTEMIACTRRLHSPVLPMNRKLQSSSLSPFAFHAKWIASGFCSEPTHRNHIRSIIPDRLGSVTNITEPGVAEGWKELLMLKMRITISLVE